MSATFHHDAGSLRRLGTLCQALLAASAGLLLQIVSAITRGQQTVVSVGDTFA